MARAKQKNLQEYNTQNNTTYFDVSNLSISKLEDEVFVILEEDNNIVLSNYGRYFRLNNPLKIWKVDYVSSHRVDKLVYKYFLQHSIYDRYIKHVDGNKHNNHYKNLTTEKFLKGYCDLTGLQFGRYRVIKVDENAFKGRMRWVCQCECGNISSVRSTDLKRGLALSCGCFNSEMSKEKNSGYNNHNWSGYEEIRGDFFKDIGRKAIKRNLEFNITIEQIWGLFIKQNRKCALSGLPLKFQSKYKSKDGTASLDRIDSSKGYTIDNIQWVHKDVNRMKLNYPEEYFINICNLISNLKKENK